MISSLDDLLNPLILANANDAHHNHCESYILPSKDCGQYTRAQVSLLIAAMARKRITKGEVSGVFLMHCCGGVMNDPDTPITFCAIKSSLMNSSDIDDFTEDFKIGDPSEGFYTLILKFKDIVQWGAFVNETKHQSKSDASFGTRCVSVVVFGIEGVIREALHVQKKLKDNYDACLQRLPSSIL